MPPPTRAGLTLLLSCMSSEWARDIDRLRRWRSHRSRDVSISDSVQKLTLDARRLHKAVNALGVAWDELVPEHLAGASSIQRLTPAGILTVRTDDAAARFELDRWLRGVGEVLVKAKSTKTVKRIRLV